MERRDEIFDAFERLVARYGLDKVTMKDLAREVGVSVGTLYLHFENKDALILAVEEKWRNHVRQRNATIIESDTTPEAKLHAIIVEHVTRFSSQIRRNQAVFELLMGAMQLRYIGRTVGDTRKEIFDSMITSTAEVLGEGCRLGRFQVDHVDLTAHLFVEAFAQYLSPPEVIKKRHSHVVKSAEAMLELLLRAIRIE